MGSLIRICVLILTISYAVNVWAWNDDRTHMALSEKAVEHSILGTARGNHIKNLGFTKGLDELFEGTYSIGTETRRGNYTVSEWVGKGGIEEDAGNIFTAYYYNHFHNPLFPFPWDQAGLNTVYPLINGESSLLWAQDVSNPWQWQRVREDYHRALTSTTNTQRSDNFVNTFKGLGHIIHLIEDSAQPAHVRNDPHPLDENGKIPGFEYWAWNNPNKVLSMSASPVFPTVSLTTAAGNYVPITPLWDTDQYNGSNPTAGTDVGISEYASANFFSEDTIISSDFTFPRLSSAQVVDRIFERRPGESYTRRYYLKTQDGETNGGQGYLLATADWLDYYRQSYPALALFLPKIPILDGNVYEDYARLLIPRAVGYSAALIDYFFRGTIELTPPDRFLYSITAPGGSFTEIRVKARNVTPNGEEMPNGSIQLVVKYRLAQQDPFQSYPVPRSDEFHYIGLPKQNGVRTIPRDMPVELVFSVSTPPSAIVPLWATDVSIQVVYQGILGNEAAGVAVGFHDISEPTPVDIINNMDYTCINGSYYVAGSPEALSLVDTNLNGIADEADIYPHKLSNVYLRWTPPSSIGYASASNYNAWISDIQPGSYGRVFILTEYEHYLSNHQTLIHPDPQDQWTWYFGDGLHAQLGLKNQSEYINGVLTRVYPTFETIRGINAWTGVRYENPAVPYGTSCITAPPTGLTGPVGFGMP